MCFRFPDSLLVNKKQTILNFRMTQCEKKTPSTEMAAAVT